MAYSAEISRGNPACFIFLLDQSGSMADPFGGGQTIRKAEFVADAVNRTLHDLVIRCTKTEEVRNYYHIGVIGYGEKVRPALPGGQVIVPISELADTPARVETRNQKVPDGAGGIVEQQIRFPVWVDASASGRTPMCEAFRLAQTTLDQWLPAHRTSFPPTVLHLTDGESTDGDPSALAAQIGALSTIDGPVLVFNCHVSARSVAKFEYPGDDSQLPDEFSKMLFHVSSPLPDQFRSAAEQIGLRVADRARGFVFNGDPVSVAQFFDIGTRPANLR